MLGFPHHNHEEETRVSETPSKTFMERHFGHVAAEVEAELVLAGKEAHTRSLDAKIGSRLKTNHPYGGTFWLALPEEVVARLVPLLGGATPFPPHGSQYELVVWNGLAILPVKVIDGAARGGQMRARVSHLRTRLTNINVAEPAEETLFDSLPEFQLDETEADSLASVNAARSAFGDVAQTMIVAAYACNPKGGLQAVEVGIARLDEDGFIQFTESQRLSLIGAPTPETKPNLVAVESFNSGHPPKPALGLVAKDKVASGEADPQGTIDPHQPK